MGEEPETGDKAEEDAGMIEERDGEWENKQGSAFLPQRKKGGGRLGREN